MFLLAVDDLVLADLGVSDLPLITSRSTRLEYDIRRRDGVAGSVYFGGAPTPATWVVACKLPDRTARDAVLAALVSDVSVERRLLAQRLDDAGTLVRARAAVTKIVETSELDLVVTFESDDSVWISDTDTTASKIFTSALDNSLVVPVPGNTRTRPVLVLTPNVQRSAGAAAVGWRYRRRYTVANASLVPWLRLPLRISLGDVTGLVTAGKSLASGADVRVVVDGIEVGRSLVGWNSAAAHVWCVLDHVPAQSSQVVEVWYGNAAAGAAPALAYPDLPPFVLASSSNASWSYAVDELAANKGLGAWYLFGTVPGAAADFTVPGAWRPVSTLPNTDNEDDHGQLPAHTYTDAGTWALGGLDVWRAAPGTANFPVTRNAYDGVGLYHPLGIVSVTCGFQLLNQNTIAALVVLARDSAAEDWQILLNYAGTLPAMTAIPSATYTPPSPVKHLAHALWPVNLNYIPDGSVGLAAAEWDVQLVVALDTTNLSITGGTEEEIYELATTLRVGGGGNGAPPYRAVQIGNASALTGPGTPRAAVALDKQAFVLDAEARTHEVWGLVPSASPWTPAALGGLLTAWYNAGAVTGVADGGAVATWRDQSPNGQDATQGTAANQPLLRLNQINGLPALDFDGTNDALSAPFSASTVGEWIFAVIRVDTVTTARTLLGASATGGRQFRVNTARQLEYNKQATASIDVSAGLITLSATALVGGQLLATSGQEIINSVEETFTHAQTLTAALTSVIGAAGASEYFDGLIAELVVCRDLTVDKWRRIEGYLASRYGLVAALAANHPFKTAPPMLPIPGSKAEDMSTHAVTAVAGYDDGGLVIEAPANDWLPLIPLRDVMTAGDFTADVAGWTPSISEAVTYAAQVGAAGSGNGQFADARGLDTDSAGQVWAADSGNKRLQAFSAVPAFVRVAGSGAGSGNGQFGAAGPLAVAVDGADNVWASDPGNHRLQRFTGSTGAYLAQLAGDGLAFLKRWERSGAPYGAPQQAATDAAGNIYVANQGNGQVLKHDPSGTYLSVVLGGQTTNYGIAVDSAGNFYTAPLWGDGTYRVASYTAAGVGRWISSSGFTGSAREYFVATDGTHVYATGQNGVITKWTCAAGIGALTFGNSAPGGPLSAPRGIAVAGGFVYVADQVLHKVVKYDTNGVYQTQWGTQGSGNGQFNQPYGLAVGGDGTIWVGDLLNSRVQQFTPTGTWLATITPQAGAGGIVATANGTVFVASFAGGVSALARWDRPLRTPQGVAVHRASGRIVTTDTLLHSVDVFESDGTYVRTIGGPDAGSGPGQFSSPVAVAINQTTGDLYVLDAGNRRVQQLTSDGTFVRAWGSPGGAPGQFQQPTGIAWNPVSGDVTVIDAGRNDMQRFTAGGSFVVATGAPGSGNGQFTHASGVAITRAGTIIYAADDTLERIQRFNAAPIGTLGWDGAVGGAVDGSLALAISTAPGVVGVAARAIDQTWHPLNYREAVQVAGWVRASSATVVPLFQIEFADEDGVVLSTATEPSWTPVPNREYRRNFAARAPARVTQYRVALAAWALTTGGTGTVWFDDLSLNANELVVRDLAMGEVGVDAAVRGRWIG